MTTSNLKRFEGGNVIAAEMKLTKTGDGLSQHLAMEPQELHVGDDVYMVIRGTVAQVGFKQAKDAPSHYVRVHTTEAVESTLVDRDAVLAILEAHRAKVAEFVGQSQIDGLAEEMGATVTTLHPNGVPQTPREDGTTPVEGDDDWEDPTPPRPLTPGERGDGATGDA